MRWYHFYLVLTIGRFYKSAVFYNSSRSVP